MSFDPSSAQAAHSSPAEPDQQSMVVPDYDGACVSNLIPALLEYPPLGEGWLPAEATQAAQVVLVVIDGLGWHQLAERAALAPMLSNATGGPITTVAPSTTAAALTSISTGSAPGDHGVVGYKIRVAGETLNTLRWTTAAGDARTRIDPREFQRLPAFGARVPAVVNKAEFIGSGFTIAHLDGVGFRPYGTTATMVWEVADAVAAGERFVYAYYDGLDRVGHERGHGSAFDAEFAFVDRLIADIRAAIPSDVAMLVTADHGQVDTSGSTLVIDDTVMNHVHAVSGEDRFVWLHCADAATKAYACAQAAHGEHAWVMPVDEVLDRGLFGRRVSAEARSRLGDVALIAKANFALVDPNVRMPSLLGRHGSLTPAEMHVPLLLV